MQKIVGIKFRSTGKAYSFDRNNLDLVCGEKVVVDSASMLCIGEVAFVKEIDENELSEPLKKVVRKATENDLKRQKELSEKASKDIFTIRKKVKELELDMKIVTAEYSLDGGKIVVDFSAEERVDFRDLLKELASLLKVRIELHQVGQRDEVKIKGGLGPCGEICCCARFLKDFEHVTVKMAKNQGLSLSPTKISGLCGRLMCCLAYENKTYEEILKKMPKINSKIHSPKGDGVVVYNDILRERVSVKVQNGDDSFVVYDFSLAELNGEKNDEEKLEKVEKPLKTFIQEKPQVVNSEKQKNLNKSEKQENQNKVKPVLQEKQQKPKENKQNSQNQNLRTNQNIENGNENQTEKKPKNKKRHWHFGKK